MTIAVVVPFRQRTGGLLARALGSIAAQPDVADIRVVVIDEASAVEPAAELATLGPMADSLRLDIVAQTREGSAAALNRGLDFLAGEDVTRVAFLDSRDAWSADHLGHANLALAAGQDCYFALTRTERSSGASGPDGPVTSAHDGPSVDGEHPFTAVEDIVERVLHGHAIAASTVVYAFDRFRQQRFDESLQRADAEAVFWLSLAQAGARFASGAGIEAGRLVDVDARPVFCESDDLTRIQNAMRYRKRLLAFDLSDAQRRFVKDAIAQLRIDFAARLVDRVIERQPIGIALLRAQFALDPISVLALPHHAGQLVADRIKGPRRPG